MAEVFRYEVIPPSSWAYLSSILMLSLFFKFGRFLSVRNLDLCLLTLLTPGLLIVQFGNDHRQEIEPEIRNLTRLLPDETVALNQKQASQFPVEEDESLQGAVGSSQNGSVPPTPTGIDDSQVKTGERRSEVVDGVAVNMVKQKILGLNTKVQEYQKLQFYGYVWLFVIGFALLIRMVLDPYMIRRPLLEPNLEFSGLTFLTIILLVFLIANIVTASVARDDIIAAESGKELATAKATSQGATHGPGYRLLFLIPVIPTFVAENNFKGSNDLAAPSEEDEAERNTNISLGVIAKIMAILGQLLIVVGIYLIGYLHFSNTRMGIGIVTLYLIMPYTAEMTGRIIHILPAAALVWAVVCYRRPGLAGIFIGLAMGLAYYPLFLLPLWFSFYWHRGVRGFLIGFVVMLAALALTLVFTSATPAHYFENLQAMFGAWTPIMENLNGIWEKGSLDASFRIPIIAAFICMSLSFAVWPAQKNLGTLLSCSAALMIAVQFWHGFDGGLLMAWYLPLALLAMFRPNLEDRTAVSLS
mgnify:CR=1 FL=1|jgi:hypothetical protein